MPRTDTQKRRVAIVGTGFSGLGLGVYLKQAGFDSFVMYEKAGRIGGTWRDNTYPGAECDIPSALYSYSFERNPRWTHKWSEQPEILAYLEHCAEKYGLYPHIRFHKEVREARFDEAAGHWRVETADGEAETFDAVVSAVGQLHRPFTPEIPGRETFEGEQFHSARWNHDYPLEGKRVAVVGNAASAIQFIPRIAPKVKALTVFQRSAHWIVPKEDREYTAFEKWLGSKVPPLMMLYRFWIWLRAESVLYPVMNWRGRWLMERLLRFQSQRYLKRTIPEPELRRKLTPDYPMGAKRVLFSDDYYDALARDNVHVETAPLARIRPNGVETENGTLHEADAIVFATGFHSTSFLTPMRVVGRAGAVLNEQWEQEGAEAYLGITHTGFPNFFMMYGPNTNLGHNSIVIMAEAQAKYIVACLRALSEHNAQWLDVKASVQQAYNRWIQERMEGKIWNAVERNWYKTESGKITNNWVGRTTEYRRITRHFNPDDYEFA